MAPADFTVFTPFSAPEKAMRSEPSVFWQTILGDLFRTLSYECV